MMTEENKKTLGQKFTRAVERRPLTVHDTRGGFGLRAGLGDFRGTAVFSGEAVSSVAATASTACSTSSLYRLGVQRFPSEGPTKKKGGPNFIQA